MATKGSARDFAVVFAALKKILAAHAGAGIVARDQPGHYELTSTIPHPRSKQSLCFGAVKTGKNYVSYHFMPVYGCPALLDGVSLALKQRMQGKACFNFREVDETLFNELAALTRRGAAGFAKAGYL